MGQINAVPLSTSSIGFYVRSLLGQTGDMFHGAASTGTPLFRVLASGAIRTPSVVISVTTGAGFIEFTDQTNPVAGIIGATRAFSDAAGRFSLAGSSTFTGAFDMSTFTGNRVYNFQDLSHIIANVPSTGAVTSDGATLSSHVEENLTTTVTQTVASTTPTVITELTSSSLPVGKYKFTGVIVFQSTLTTVGVGLRINGAGATITPCFAKWQIATGANGVNHDFVYDQITATDNITTSSVSAANTNMLAVVSGTFSVTIAGAVAIELRSETGVAVSIRSGSFINIEAI